MTHALKESGYESDSTLVFRRREDVSPLSPIEQRIAYKTVQKGGDVPLHGFRKLAPERPKESPRRYVEGEVTIHYRSPVRTEAKEPLSEEELARRSAENMRRVYQEERRRKYLQELHDIDSRRHTDNFIPSQKSPIPLNRYDDFVDDLSYRSRSQEQTPEPRLVARALYNFIGQSPRELTFRRGDFIYVRRQVDKNWYEGEHNAMVGLFPFNYVEKLPSKENPWLLQLLIVSCPMARPVVSSVWDLIIIRPRYQLILTQRSPTIIHCRGGTKVNVESLNEALHIDTHSEPIPLVFREKIRAIARHECTNFVCRLRYRALYNYRPQNADELELNEGDTVFVMEKCDDGWYVGSSQRTGFFGTFPGNYVERLNDNFARGYRYGSTPGRDPTTARHGDFWLLGYPPGPVRLSLTNLATSDSSEVPILMASLVRTPSRRGAVPAVSPSLRSSTTTSLQ
ncbi:unnamed protein product [Trichogramma brassicae]|uniref:SH3 domain-containing protein n=1 Tax=Trichogramma brassicae TaxID=86971 RepID=A0A6H5IUM3_9HYME|nr:unnamed protein product [Trichogramma brassicae]